MAADNVSASTVHIPDGKIAFFLPNLSSGGAERVLLNLANGIAARGYNVDVVVAQAQGEFMTQVVPEITVVNLQAPRILSSIAPLTQYLRRVQPAVLVSAIHANYAALLVRGLSRVATKVAVTQHTNLSTHVRESSSMKVQMEPYVIRTLFRQADKIIAVSTGVADDLAITAGVQRERIDVIYNPVIMPGMAAKKAAEIEHPWFGPDKPPVILGVGRLMHEKGFEYLIEAFAKVRAQRPAKLMLLGEGPLRPTLESRIRQENLVDDVALVGYVDNPYAYMSNAALFVLSSLREGLPTVLVEAMYCGTPVVSTDCPSGPREILKDGLYGHLVEPANPDALSGAMIRALDGDIPMPSRQSWEPFLMDVAIDQYLDVLFS